jgi:hypothetical protein
MQVNLERYVDLPEPDLYLALSAAISGGNSSPQNQEDAERTGFEYFRSSLPTIRLLVCSSTLAKSFVGRDDAFAVASGVAELIAGHFKLPAVVATMAVLSARMGLTALCPPDLK